MSKETSSNAGSKEAAGSEKPADDAASTTNAPAMGGTITAIGGKTDNLNQA